MRLMYGSALPIQCYSTLSSHGTPLFPTPMSLLILLPAHRHPCNEKPSAIADITLRLSEGIQELKLEQQLAPTREAISRTITTGSANFFKAVEGVKGRLIKRSASSNSVSSTSTSSGTMISKSEVLDGSGLTASPPLPAAPAPTGMETTAIQAKERVSGWGVSVGSFLASRAARFSTQRTPSSTVSAPSSAAGSPVPPPQEVSWRHSSSASTPASPTGDVKPPPTIQTPAPGPVPVDLGEKTPRGDGFHHEGDAESQGPSREHEPAQDGDSDEEPSFGVAL